MTTSKILRRSGKAVVEYLSLLEFEPDLVCIIGVGIHHGEVFEMREAWPNIELYGFEPHPDTYKAIVETFPGRLYHSAISNEKGFLTLYSKPKHKDGASIFPKIKKEDRIQCNEIEVICITLDDVIGHMLCGLDAETNKSRKGLLWLDCEGNELAALEGGKRFIDNCISVINVELTGKPRSEGWSKPLDVHNKLVEYGFLQAWNHTNRSVIGQWDAIYIKRELFKPEFCSIPQSIAEYEKGQLE